MLCGTVGKSVFSVEFLGSNSVVKTFLVIRELSMVKSQSLVIFVSSEGVWLRFCVQVCNTVDNCRNFWRKISMPIKVGISIPYTLLDIFLTIISKSQHKCQY